MRNCSTGTKWALAALLICALAAVCADPPPLRADDASGRILVIPFRIEGCEGNKDILDFSEHVNRHLRRSIDLRGGALSIETAETVDKLLEERGAPVEDEQACELARSAGADWVIFGLLSCSESTYRMRGVMWDVRRGRRSVVTDLEVGSIFNLPQVLGIFVQNVNTRIHGSPRLPLYSSAEGDPKTRLAASHPTPGFSAERGPWRSPEIPGAVRSLDIGDLDGDKRNELVLLAENGLSIRRFERGALRTLAQFSESPAAYVSSEVEDIDGDGVAELIVSYRKPDGMESAIIRYVNRDLRVSDRFPHRIAASVPDPHNPGRRVLVAQRTDVDNLFTGEAALYRFEDGNFREVGSTMLPPGTFLLSYASGVLGKNGQFMRVILNQDRRIMVFDRENRLLYSVTDRIYGLNRRISIPGRDGEQREITFPGRLLITDTNGDSENELLVIKYVAGGSEIQDLVWEGGRFVEKWKTIRSRGLLSDFSIRDFKNHGSRSLVAILLTTNPFQLLLGGPQSVVFAYDLGM